MSTEQEHSDEAVDEDDKPRGTLFIMICFLIMMIAMWSWVYFEMIVG
ncbi:MAG: hypothetical protein ACERLM_07935 [Acidimicrobiales bacterium]